MACRWQPGMKITALLDALNSALAEPFALAWSQDSPRFLLVFTVIYAVAVIVAVSDQKNTHPGAEHGSAAWGDVFRLNKFYMDKRGPNLLLTQHFHIGIDGYKHKHNTNILIVGGSGAGKTRTYGVPNVLECACSMVITDPKAEILRKTGNLLKQKGYEVIVFDLINPAASFCYNPFVYVHDAARRRDCTVRRGRPVICAISRNLSCCANRSNTSSRCSGSNWAVSARRFAFSSAAAKPLS